MAYLIRNPSALLSRARFFALALILFCGFSLSTHAQVSAFEDPSRGGAGGDAASVQELAPAKPEIDGGDILQGQTAQVIVVLRNTTGGPLKVEKIELVPSSNVTATLGNSQCSTEDVKPGIECILTVSIKAESSGKYRVGLLITHNGRTKISNAAIVGTIGGAGGNAANGMPANEIEAFPGALDFQTAKGRAPLVRSIALRNSSTKAIDIQSIDLLASPLTGFSISAPNCQTLQPSQACVATVTWTPSVEGQAEGVVVLAHSGPSGSLQIPVKGEYQLEKTAKAETFPTLVPGEGLIVADREEIDFGSTIDGAASITVSLINAGDKSVTLRQVKLAGSDNGLSLSGEDCTGGKVLNPNEGCALTVNWLPRRKGPVIDDIQVIHTGARGVLVLPVRGTAKEIVNLNLPVLNSSMPKVKRASLDESVLKSADEKTPEKKTHTNNGEFSLATDISALNGYRVSSLSPNRAVITGPNGRIVVLDGEVEVIAGGHWIPRIMPEGVELIGENDSVFLLFDRSLGNSGVVTTDTTFPTATQAASTPTPTDALTGSGVTTP